MPLDLRVDVQRGLHLLKHPLPGIGKHRAGGIDNENDVLAIDWDTSNQLIFLLAVNTQQTFFLPHSAVVGR